MNWGEVFEHAAALFVFGLAGGAGFLIPTVGAVWLVQRITGRK